MRVGNEYNEIKLLFILSDAQFEQSYGGIASLSAESIGGIVGAHLAPKTASNGAPRMKSSREIAGRPRRGNEASVVPAAMRRS